MDSEINACRHDDLVGRLREAGLATIADLGFVGLTDEAEVGGHHRLQETQGQEAAAREEAGQPADRSGTGSA
ncbi:hypothetical protein ACFYM3_26840 [Streptomyces massasporeus]|uniref:Transposase n=1 Tax=Streptomyces massasporeus TaxID=67324 RepID=A0ABW6LLL5_9ACTN